MEDPWGDPWTTDTPVKLDLPAAPRQAHFAAGGSNGSPRKASPDGESPWNNDDNDNAWGGWNDAGAGKDTPAWGRSPGLKPLGGAVVVVTQQPLDSWGGSGTVEEQEVEEKGRDERIADSAISLDEDGARRENSLVIETDGELPEVLVEIPTDVWNAENPTLEEAAATTSPAVELERSESPDIIPGPAAGAPDRLEAGRQPSKVQELVEMYDGIAKKGVSSTELSATKTKSFSIPGAAHDDVVAEDTNIVSTKGPQDDFAEVLLKDLAEEKPNDVSEAVDVPESTAMSDDLQDDAPPQTKPKPPRIPFPIDLSTLDDLFPSSPAVSAEPELVPDVIIDDSFRTVSERKAWYHISRSGSIRQHNSGEDEGYVRIRWAGSQVREQTHKIVRRWMEEDSIGGRVVLGRRLGAGGASMFNWDSEAPPVEIGKLLKKKESVQSRQIPASLKGAEMGFGWNESLPTSDTLPTAPPSSEGLSRKSTSDEPGQSVSERPVSLQLPAPPKSVPTTAPLRITTAPPKTPAAPETGLNEVDEEDDDDWGEMVSSPTVPGTSSGMLLAGAMAMDLANPSAGYHPGQGDAPAGADTSGTANGTGIGHQNIPGHESVSRDVADVTTPHSLEDIQPPSPSQPMPNWPTKPELGPVSPPTSIYDITANSLRETTQVVSEPRSSQDEEVASTILRDLPNLSYMLQ